MSSYLLFVFRRANRRARCPAGSLRDEHQGGADPDDEGLPAWPERVRERAHLAVAGRKPALNFKGHHLTRHKNQRQFRETAWILCKNSNLSFVKN